VTARNTAIEVVSHAPDNRLNEDAWLVLHTGPLGERIVFAAIDGATTRMTPPPLQRHLESLPERLTPAAFAARSTRSALARHLIDGMLPDLRAALLEANADLGRTLIGLFGALTLEGMGFPEEIYATLAKDPRQVRLGLPACVVTLAEYDPTEHTLRYAHTGDTSLLVLYEDGRVAVPTQPEGAAHDNDLKQQANRLRQQRPDLPFRELVEQPEIQTQNLQSGIRHNYVDEHSLPQPSQGIGVVNGQPELRYFIQTGQLYLDRAIFVCALTDGLEWPASAREVFTEDPDEAAALLVERREFMAAEICERSLAGYLDLLRQTERDDRDHEEYPRLKTHDDATGVLLWLET